MRRRGFPSSRLCAAAFIGALGLVLALVLSLPSARVPLREPLVPKATRGAAAAVPLEARDGPRQTRVYRLTLSAAEPAALRDHDELQLLFASTPPRRLLRAAELRARITGCRLVAEAEELRDGQPIAFRRSAACPGLASGAELDLTLELEGDGTLALLGFESVPDSPPGPLRIAPRAAGASGWDVRGAVVDYTAPAPRVELLTHMWRLAPGTAWLWLSVAAGVALALAACLLFPNRERKSDAPCEARALFTAATASACLAAGLGVLYAVLVPPLMAPDEPYHLLGFADLGANRALADDTVVWMGQTHLWRIRYQPTERFRSIDVGRPYVAEDGQLRATEVAMRSAVLARLWRPVVPLLVGEPAPRVLLTLRLLNVLLFATTAGAAAAFAFATVNEPFPQWLCAAFFLAPSLPFFAMHVSETAVLCAIFVILATALAVLFLDGPRADWCGLPLGAGTGLMLAGGRSPWPLAPLVLAALLGRILLGSRARDPRRGALAFWAGFAGGASVLFLIEDAAYRDMTLLWAEHYTAGIPPWLRHSVEWLLARPAAALLLAALAAAVERALAGPRLWLSARITAVAPKVVRSVALALALFVVLSLALSLVLPYPQLELEPRHELTAAERVSAVLATMATMFRLSQPNFLLATSFWVGFGWLDTSPKPWFETAVTALVAGLVVLLLVHLAVRAEARRLLWLLIFGAGAALSLVFYAVTTQVAKPLHGRYLVGYYLCVLAITGSALAMDHRPASAAAASSPGRGLRAVFLLGAIGLIHVYCLAFILARYF